MIGLPAKHFLWHEYSNLYSFIFKKCREADEDILFIDASKEFEKKKNQNVLLNEHIDKIVDAYQNRTVIEKFNHKSNFTRGCR